MSQRCRVVEYKVRVHIFRMNITSLMVRDMTDMKHALYRSFSCVTTSSTLLEFTGIALHFICYVSFMYYLTSITMALCRTSDGPLS
jgi:hypothetical protein